MFHSLNDIRHFGVETTDGGAGTLEDLLYEPATYRLRWLKVDFGNILESDEALVDVRDTADIDLARERIRVALNRSEIKPPEAGALAAGGSAESNSAAALLNCPVVADSKRVGFVEDVVLDGPCARLRYLLAGTGRFSRGALVLSVDWIDAVDTLAGEIAVSLQPRAIETAPTIGDVCELDRSGEARLYRHHGLRPYWD